MGAIAKIFRTFGPEYLARYPDMLLQHKKIVDAIIKCRSGQYGVAVYQCDSCGKKHYIDRSCGNRHCPQCQYHKSRQWLEAQLNRRLPAGNTFYLPVKALSKIFRAKFKAEMTRRGLLHKIDPSCWQIAWNVNCQAIGDSEATLKYLAPYIFRVAISDSRIMIVKDRTVTFSYRKKGSNRNRKVTLDVIEFIRRFLQHVLPTGFMKVRHYGFMNSNCTVSLARLRLIILAGLQNIRLCLTDLSAIKPKPALPKPLCPACGGFLLYLFSLIPVRPCRGPT